MRTSAMMLFLALSSTAATLVAVDNARAEVFYNCGHEIHTSYSEGWVLIDSMTGIEGRDDIWVWGLWKTPEGHEILYQQPVQNVINQRQRWGYNYSYVYIGGHPECSVPLH